MRALGIIGAGLIFWSGCGTPPVQTTPPPPTFTTVATAPLQGMALTRQTVEVGSDVEQLGLSQNGNLVVTSGGATMEFVGGALTKRTLYAGVGEQTTLGAVKAINPRLAGGAWLAAGNGLFELEGQYVTRSPLSVGQVAVSVDQARGPLVGLWLGTDDGLVRRAMDTQRFKLDGVGPEVTQLALEPNGKAAIAVIGGKPFVLRAQGTTIAAELPPSLVGSAHAVAASPDTLFAATDSGLWRYGVTAEGLAWTRLMLATGTEPKKVQALAVDPVSGTLWARADAELLRIEGDKATSFTAPAAMKGFAVDQLGDVWLPNGKQLLRMKGGDNKPVSFATELKPWLKVNCTSCHADFLELAQFSLRAEAALFRVTSGDMPRCSGGTPCPADQRLKDTAALEQWIRSGKQP